MTSLGAKYQVGDKIGGGGMAEVYRGELVGAEGFARPVAIKRVHASFSRDARFGDMFVNEARIASLLHHANICSVLDFDRDDDGRYYLVMELVDGVDLLALLRSGRLPVAVTLHVIAELLKGLDYAHELAVGGKRLGIVHRDVSPHNVMLSWDGGVKLVDFGIAKAVAATNAVQSGVLKGKVGYMSPEQIKTEPLDGRSDLFALGIMLHEMLTGRRLFGGAQESVVLARVLAQPVPRPGELVDDVAADVEAVTMKLLERDRDQRFASAHAALEALLGCAAITARGPLELRRLLAERFPDRDASRARDEPEPVSELETAETDLPPVPDTTPARPRSDAPPTAIGTLTDPASVPTERGVAATELAPPRPALPPTLPSPEVIAAAERTTVPAVAAPVRREARSRRNAALLGMTVLVSAAAIFGALLVRDHLAARRASAREEANAPAKAPPPSPAPSAPAADAAPAIVHDAAGPVVADVARDAAPAPANAPPRDRPATRRKPPDRAPAERVPRAGSPEPNGRLYVRVDPWAEITVDGSPAGQTPKTLSLSPGVHTVRIENDGIKRRETVKVTIRSKRTSELIRNWK